MSASTSPVEYRPAVEGDLEIGSRIFNRAQNELYHRHGFTRTDRPVEIFAGPQGHVLTHDPNRCFVAEVRGPLVAFSSAIVRADAWYCSALFVDPEFQGHGIGRHLFELSAAGWPARRMTIADAIQPVSTGLYASKGLIPSTPILVVGGRPSIDAPADVEPSGPTPADLAALDLAVYGFDRAIDHAFWGTQAVATLWRRNGQSLAYTYVSSGGWIGPLAGRDEASAAEALRAELARQTNVTLEIPGSAAALVEAAFAAGLRLVNPPGFLLHSRPARTPTALVISGYWLF